MHDLFVIIIGSTFILMAFEPVNPVSLYNYFEMGSYWSPTRLFNIALPLLLKLNRFDHVIPNPNSITREIDLTSFNTVKTVHNLFVIIIICGRFISMAFERLHLVCLYDRFEMV